MSAMAGNQYGEERVFGPGEGDGIDSDKKVRCANCNVVAVPRGITSSRKLLAAGEKHCPNCGHVHGRDNH